MKLGILKGGEEDGKSFEPGRNNRNKFENPR